MRRIYETRRDVLALALNRHLGSALRFRIPDGGMGLWTHVDESIDLRAWVEACEHQGVQCFSGSRYDFHQREPPYMRLGFSYLDEAELEEAVQRMAHALSRVHTPHLRHAGKGVPTLHHRA